MKIDLKTVITLATLLFAIAGFYYTTKNDIEALDLKVRGLQVEHHDIRKRQGMINKKLTKINKKIKDLEK